MRELAFICAALFDQREMRLRSFIRELDRHAVIVGRANDLGRTEDRSGLVEFK